MMMRKRMLTCLKECLRGSNWSEAKKSRWGSFDAPLSDPKSPFNKIGTPSDVYKDTATPYLIFYPDKAPAILLFSGQQLLLSQRDSYCTLLMLDIYCVDLSQGWQWDVDLIWSVAPPAEDGAETLPCRHRLLTQPELMAAWITFRPPIRVSYPTFLPAPPLWLPNTSCQSVPPRLPTHHCIERNPAPQTNTINSTKCQFIFLVPLTSLRRPQIHRISRDQKFGIYSLKSWILCFLLYWAFSIH